MNTRHAIAISAIMLVAQAAFTAWAWAQIPEGAQVPMHWNLSGQIDRYGTKAEGLLAIPLLTVAVAALLAVVPRIEPRRQHLARSQGAYSALWVAIVGFLALLQAPVGLAAMGRVVPVERMVPAGVGVLLCIVGLALPRLQSNFLVGVRTPWTLSSEASWERTHRLAGRLFVALGIVLALASAMAPGEAVWILVIGGVLAVTATVTVYSYVVWRGDPDKQSLGR